MRISIPGAKGRAMSPTFHGFPWTPPLRPAHSASDKLNPENFT